MPRKIAQEIIDSLELMIVDMKNLRLDLPQDTKFKNYTQVKKTLTNAGGTYKKNGFVFPNNPQAVLDRLVSGEEVNDKKKYQQFFTPYDLATYLIKLAEIEKHHRFLEPSAGNGAIFNHALTKTDNVVAVEILDDNCEELRRRGYQPMQADFLTLTKKDIGMFDRIVANPPFTKNQDIYHLDHMWKLLNPGGRLVCITSTSWASGSQKKQIAFRDGLAKLGAEIHQVEAGTFKQSGTSIATLIVVLNKKEK